MPKQHYIGVKMIEAEPMSNREFHLGIPRDDDKETGYRVTYPDGYVSWSPADVFEGAYFPLDDASRITSADVDRFAGPVASQQLDPKSTLASVRTLTGFVQHEVSSCVDAANFDMAIGAKIGYERIKSKLWGHMGFLLQWARFGLTGHAEREKAKREDEPEPVGQVLIDTLEQWVNGYNASMSQRHEVLAEARQLVERVQARYPVFGWDIGKKPHTEAECGPGCTRACPPDCGCIVCVTDRRRRTGKGADCDCTSCRNVRIRKAGEAAATTLGMTEASAVKAMAALDEVEVPTEGRMVYMDTDDINAEGDDADEIDYHPHIAKLEAKGGMGVAVDALKRLCGCPECAPEAWPTMPKLEPNAPIWQPVPCSNCTQCGALKVPDPQTIGTICPASCDAPKEGWIGPMCPKCRDSCRWTEPDASGRSYCTACRRHGSEGLDKTVATIRKVVDSNADKPQVASGKPPHVERMIDEAVQLREKLGKLKAFMILPMYEKIDKAEQKRMNRQRMGMEDYLRALDERIDVALEGLNKRDDKPCPECGDNDWCDGAIVGGASRVCRTCLSRNMDNNPKETPR